MEQLRKLFALSLLIISISYSCDILQEDVLPTGDELFNVDTNIKLKRAKPFVLDLGRAIQSAEGVKFQIGKHPSKGSIDFFEDTYVKYEPSDDFKEGSDSFSIEMYDTEDQLLDADTISIELLSEEADIPCLNGAMSDYFWIEKAERLEFNPIENDGYCEEEVSEYEIFILVEPKNGAAEKIEGINFVYEPDSAFQGYDYFVYGLEMVDTEGVVHYSAAIVEIKVEEEDKEDCRYDLFKLEKVFFITEEVPYNDYLIDIYKGDEEDCEVGSWSITIDEVAFGRAEVDSSQTAINYFPVEEVDSVDYIKYVITFEDNMELEGSIYIFFDETYSEYCAEAYADEYDYYAIPDSVTQVVEPFYANPAENDEYCNENYSLNILEQPSIGEASITEDKRLKYQFFEELAGDFEVKIKYEICNEGKCDYEYIYLDVYQSGAGANCAEAYDDEYIYFAGTDSLTNDVYWYPMDPAANDSYCNEDFELSILEQPEYGEAKVSDDKRIDFYMEVLPEEYTEVKIKYEICNEGECDYAYIELKIDIDDEASTQCVVLKDDEYTYQVVPDSATQEVEPFVFDPTSNDHICSEAYEIEIIDSPNYGQAEVSEDQTIIFSVPEEFEGEEAVELTYKVCVGEDCEDAEVYIKIIR